MDFINILESTHNIKLNEEQLKAVTHVCGPALVLSGPGSGKTTVITSRCAYLIMEARINPRNILTLTFNRAAKLEMESRFSRIYKDGPKPGFGTIHSFCNMIVGDYERRQGKRFRRIEGEEEDKRKIIKNIYTRINGININEDELEDLINEIGLVKNRMIKDLDNIESSIKNFTEVFKFYEEYKRSNLLIDFDDMLTYAYSILNKCPDLLISYRNRYTFLQVDEGQDLSKVQFEILKLLAGPGKGNIFIVADDDQSIYGFRGATPGHIFDFEKEFTGLKILKLENNYRSSGNIVGISSDFIRSNQERYDKCHKTVNDFFEDPFILDFINMKEQLKFIIETIKSHLEENSNIEIAILYRNNISSVLIADAIDTAGINIKIMQNKLFFFRHWIVQDILAFLRFSQNQSDKEAFFRIYNKMNRFISRQMAENAQSHESSKSLIDSIIETCDLKPFQTNRFNELKNEFSMLASLHPEDALRYIEEGFKYF
ncbi:MAG TPA: ATP-dependent helicase, partial [Clostridia bacterium]